MLDQIKESLYLYNGFEKALITYKGTPNRTIQLTAPIDQIESNKDVSEVLIGLAEKSKQFVSEYITSRVFDIDGENNIRLTVEFYSGSGIGIKKLIPIIATIEDYLGI